MDEKMTLNEVTDMLRGMGLSYTTTWFDCVEYSLGNVCVTANEWSIRIGARGVVDPTYEFDSAFPVRKDEFLQALAKAVLKYG